MDARIFEHNNWANGALIEACAALADDVLDAPQPRSEWSIRRVLVHLVQCQRDYLWILTEPPPAADRVPPPFDRLREVAAASGDALLALARGGEHPRDLLRTSDGYDIVPWVVLCQVVNHAADHRRQVCDMLRAVGVAPPKLDGWTFGEAEGAVVELAD